MNKTIAIIIILASTLLFGCGQGADSQAGVNLPYGVMGRGKAVFKKYQCLACHSIEGYEDNAVPIRLDPPINFCSKSSKLNTYSQRVNLLVNPSHNITQQAANAAAVTSNGDIPQMENFNNLMTVTELTDVVAFLQHAYDRQ